MDIQNIKQNLDLLIPITVTPYVKVGEIACEDIKINQEDIELKHSQDKCRFTIKQKINITIPLSVEAEAVVGDHSVSFEGISLGNPAPTDTQET